MGVKAMGSAKLLLLAQGPLLQLQSRVAERLALIGGFVILVQLGGCFPCTNNRDIRVGRSMW